MNAQQFLLRHGEKIVVALVAVICVYVVLSSLTDESVRPKDGLTKQTLQDAFGEIDRVRAEQTPPILKPPADYREMVLSNLRRAPRARPVMGWLTAHPDLGKVSRVEKFLYIYHLRAPEVRAVDQIGRIEVTITPPAARVPSGAEDRTSDESQREWQRPKTEIRNRAYQVGVVVEVQEGKGPWQPLTQAGDKGFIRFAQTDGLGKGAAAQSQPVTIVLPEVKAWERYAFRARIVAAATGYTYPADEAVVEPDQAVLVHIGNLPTQTAEELKKTPNEELLKLGFVRGAPRPGLQSKELAYESQNSPEAVVSQAASTIRIALKNVAEVLGQPGVIEARMLMRQFMRFGDESGWVPDKGSVEYRLQSEQKLGDKQVLVMPFGPHRGKKLEVSFETPFVFARAQQGVERQVYYWIKLVSRQAGQKGKKLELQLKTIQTDVAFFKNQRNGQDVPFFKLINIPVRTRADEPMFPDFPNSKSQFNEEELFEGGAQGAGQIQLKLPEPKVHKPGEGPLAELQKQDNDPFKTTDTDYVEFPDGRMYWWEPQNGKLERAWRPGTGPRKVEPEKPATEQPAAGAETPAPTGGPAGAEAKPGTPPAAGVKPAQR